MYGRVRMNRGLKFLSGYCAIRLPKKLTCKQSCLLGEA